MNKYYVSVTVRWGARPCGKREGRFRAGRLHSVPAGLLLASLLSGSVCLADTVEISGGGHAAGVVRSNADYTVIKIDDQIKVALPNSRVQRTVKSDQLAAYRQRAAAAGDGAQRHYQLAIWCGKNVPGQTEFYKQLHMRRAVELDPNHAAARAWLGYTKQKSTGKWVLSDDLMHRRGMVLRKGRWELPEADAINQSQSTANVATKQWIRDVRRLVKTATGNNDRKVAEALAALDAIDDPSAATAIALQLSESRNKRTQSREMRERWVKLLGRFRNRVSVEALVRAGIEEPDAYVREAALTQLTEYGADSAVATYLPMLKSDNNDLVNRAARALAWFPDPELALDYVDALVTEHKWTAPGGPGMSVGFGDDGTGRDQGLGGLAFGGKPKTKVSKATNPAVLSLLKKIEPVANYGYDEQQWLEYFARQRGEYSGDLRRDH